MRYEFDQIFHQEKDKRLTPKLDIQIGNARIGPGLTFGPGIEFSGVNIFDFKDYDIEAEEQGDLLVIKGFYKNHE